MVLRPGYDWVFPYYRDRTLALALGVTPEDMLLQAVGAARDPASGGRQMPSHWGSPELHIFTGSSPTGTQFVQAMGAANARNVCKPGLRRNYARLNRGRGDQRRRILGVHEFRVPRQASAVGSCGG